jgi:hypothetical protein
LKDKIPAGKRVITDSSYKAEDGKTVPTTHRSDTAEVRELNRILAMVPLTAPFLGSFFKRGISPSKIGPKVFY